MTKNQASMYTAKKAGKSILTDVPSIQLELLSKFNYHI